MLIAVDVDGTLYDGVRAWPEGVEALMGARLAGHRVLIVSGRRWESLLDIVPAIVDLADGAVCEDGGLFVATRCREPVLLGPPVEPALVAGLRDALVPDLDVGRVVVGAPATWLDVVLRVRERVGSDRHVVRNKNSVALVPRGCDKGAGLLAAVAALGLTGDEIVAIGDAANDLPMFAVATHAFGVANADDAVRASGVRITREPVGRGVAEALASVLG